MKVFARSCLFALTVALVSGSVEAGTILFNPNGTGLGGSSPINEFEYSRGNALAVGGISAVGNFISNRDFGTNLDTSFELYFQTTIATATISGNQTTNALPPNVGQFTVVGAVTETVVDVVGTTATFGIAPQPSTNYFEIWHNTVSTPNMLEGTGFNEGTLILSGIIGDGGGANAFANISPPLPLVNFDQVSGDPAFAGIQTVVGFGSSSFELELTALWWDPGYFPSLFEFTSFSLTAGANTPFQQVAPSKRFLTNTTGLNSSVGFAPVSAGASIGSVGAINGADGPDFQLEIDATSTFSGQVVPEPSSIAMLGLFSLGLVFGGARRLNRNRKARA